VQNNEDRTVIMKRIVNILVAVLLSCSWTFASVGEQGPTADIKPVLDKLTDILNDEKLKGDDHLVERREKIMSQIKAGFDFREMSKRVLGRTWGQLSEEERDYFTQLLTTLLENVYVGKLEGYSGQTIEYAEETVKGTRAQVTTLITHNDVKLPVHYIMKQREDLGRWVVYDINIEGISLVRNYQQQFQSILRKEKYEGLVKILEEKNRSFLAADQQNGK
jgi:phospholipid transport system substrate-binding protein